MFWKDDWYLPLGERNSSHGRSAMRTFFMARPRKQSGGRGRKPKRKLLAHSSVSFPYTAMPPRKSPARSRQLVLLIGTVKGLFLYHSDESRKTWKLTGPHLGGWEVFSVCGDSRNERILVGT